MTSSTAKKWKNRQAFGTTYGPTDEPTINVPVTTDAGFAEVEVDVERDDGRVLVEMDESGVRAEGELVATWDELEEQARQRANELREYKLEQARETVKERREEVNLLRELMANVPRERFEVMERVIGRVELDLESAKDRVEVLREGAGQLGIGIDV